MSAISAKAPYEEAVTPAESVPAPYFRFDLLQLPLVGTLIRHRVFPFVLLLVNLFFFALVILTGLVGTPIGNHNLSIIFVWIVWWALLIILLIP
ncbi:MAG: hypothetical protein Q8P59_07795, partial [Dehalococcoidia bacterium]|nr:hypothetical protein [Dehalococcoidia bacterium]